MPTRPRLILLLLVAALAAGLLAACGSEDDSSSQDVNSLLNETFSGDKKIESGKLDLTLGVDAKGAQGLSGPINIKLAGPFQSQGAQKLPKFKFDLSFSGAGQSLTAGATSTGDKGFVRWQGQDYAISDQVFNQFKTGYEQAQKQGGNQKNPSLATLGIDPRKWLTNPRNEGKAKVGDTETIKISGGVDVPKLLDDLNKALAKAQSLGLQGTGNLPSQLTDAQKQQAADAVKKLDVEIYTGADDKTLRRLLVTMDLDVPKTSSSTGGQAAIKFDMSFTDLNEDQEVAAPSSAKPFDELVGQLGSLGLGGLGSSSGSSGSGSSGSGSSGGTSADKLERYSDCIAKAGSDASKAQDCAKLLTE